MKDVSPQKVGT
jgi:hypothetical protein